MIEAVFGTVGRKITGRTVLLGLIAFFGVIATVNGVFIYFAIDSWPGLSQTDAYREGIRYNDVLDEARRQAELGWKTDVALDLKDGLTVRVLDRDSTPVRGLAVAASLARPVGDEQRREVALSETAAGVYRARIDADAGQWRIGIAANSAGGARYRMMHEIWVKP